MTVFMGGDIDVALMGEDFRDWQPIRMRPEGDAWRIVEMR